MNNTFSIYSAMVWRHNFHSSLIVIILAILFTLSASSGYEGVNKFGCDVQRDHKFHGLFVNCSERSLHLKNLTEFENSEGITHLDISHNNFKILSNDVFGRFINLTWLECHHCELEKLGCRALEGLEKLQILNLENNKLTLSEKKFPVGFFKNLTSLKQLYIADNGNNGDYVDYSMFVDIFDTSRGLTHLSIDSFADFRLGREFLKLSKLYCLQINFNTDTKYIRNESLKEFYNSSIRVFGLTGGNRFFDMREKGADVFQFLPQTVSHLFIHGPKLSNQHVLRMLKPLGGRVMDTISLNSVYTPVLGDWDSKVLDKFIDKEGLKYLGNISLTKFYWYDSNVYAFPPVIPDTWKKNLTIFQIQSDAMIETDLSMFFKVTQMENLETFVMLASTVPYNIGNDMPDDTISNNMHDLDLIHQVNPMHSMKDDNVLQQNKERPELLEIVTPLIKSEEIYESLSNLITPDLQKSNLTDKVNSSVVFNKDSNKEGDNNERITSWFNLETMMKADFVNMLNHHPDWKMTCPPHLKSVVINAAHYIRMGFKFYFKACGVKEIVIANTVDQIYLSGIVYGLDNLRTLNLKGTKIVTDMNLDFFDTLPSIKNLVLSQTSPTPNFYHKNAQRIIKKLIYLEYFDLSESGLSELPTNMFNTNRHLKKLWLNKNRFSNIPFALNNTPELEELDLRNNVFNVLSLEERQSIDNHIKKVPTFKIKFDGNRLSCTCSDYDFISWLQSNLQHFDNNGNYSCTSGDPSKHNTADFIDVEAYWRHCQGEYSFHVSVILALGLIVVYLAIFVWMKKKTEIISQLRQWVLPTFLMKREDFPLDVCIGYASQDGAYVRNVILKYLQDEWGLKTFVHDRDLLQDPLAMNDALRDCWRCVLLITKTFLYDDPKAHNIMKVSTFFVSPTNPRKVIVLVEECVRHQIPDFVNQVVDEDNIIGLPSLEFDLSYEARETLNTRILKC